MVEPVKKHHEVARLHKRGSSEAYCSGFFEQSKQYYSMENYCSFANGFQTFVSHSWGTTTVPLNE